MGGGYPVAAKETRYITAITEALQEEMRRDPSVFVIGEDVRAGAFGYTMGMLAEFGEDRVINTPISESGFCGAALGAAMHGLRPVVDLKISSLMYVALDPIVNGAAKVRYMFGGQTKVPVVYLCRSGAPGNNAAQHSDNPYPLLINSPGLKVVTPADAYDMKGLLKTAIRDDDPVAVLATVRGASAMVPAEEYTIPLGQGAVKRVGSDVTVVAIMHLVAEALAAAEELEKEEISVEVVDPRTLVPLDRDMIFASVAKTGRLVIADDSPRSCGFAAEVAALVAEEIVDVLKAPIRRVTRLNVPIPFSTPMENMVLPNRQKIVAAVRETVSAARKGQTR